MVRLGDGRTFKVGALVEVRHPRAPTTTTWVWVESGWLDGAPERFVAVDQWGNTWCPRDEDIIG